MKVLTPDSTNSEKGNNLKLQNDQAFKKIEMYKYQAGLLEILRSHFEKMAKLPFLPTFLRAKFMLRSLEFKSELIAKQHFIQIYSERVVNTKYAERVLKPDSEN